MTFWHALEFEDKTGVMSSPHGTAIPPEAIERAKTWCKDYIRPERFGLMNVISGDPIPWDAAIDVATRDAKSLQEERELPKQGDEKSDRPENLKRASIRPPSPRDAFIREQLLPGTKRRLAIIGEGGSGKSE